VESKVVPLDLTVIVDIILRRSDPVWFHLFQCIIFTFAYTIFRCVNQLNVKVLVISVRTQLHDLHVFLFCH
jgi:hypothetical protein